MQALNQAARACLRAANQLGDEVTLGVERGSRDFAAGDRVMFQKNERSLGVKNGSLGTIRSVSPISMAVMLDDGRAVAFDLKEYNQIDHGYAATIHKAQGMTVDRVHVLATPGLDRHGAYVALSRHRDSVDLHYGADDFADRDRLVRTLGRERGKDMVADYTQDSADRRQVQTPAMAAERTRPGATRDPFAGLDLRPVHPPPARDRAVAPTRPLSPGPRAAEPVSLSTAVQRFARATADIMRMRKDGYTELAHQTIAFQKAAAQLDAARPDAARDLRAAFARDGELVSEAAAGRTSAAIRAMALEAELRATPEKRADRFVKDWQKLERAHQAMRNAGDHKGQSVIEKQMTGMAKSIERDAQAESLVRKRLPRLGIEVGTGVSLSQDIQRWIGLSRGRGIGLDL